MLVSLLVALQSSANLEEVASRLAVTGGAGQVRREHGRAEIWFELSGSIKSKSLKALSGVSRLTSIRIFSEDLTDSLVADIKDNPDLNLLVVMSSKLTDKCTVSIANMTGLTKLDLNKAVLTKVGIERIAKLPKLERLYLYNAKVADSALDPLKKSKQLKVLDLPPFVSEKTLRAMRAALPKTDVECRRTDH